MPASRGVRYLYRDGRSVQPPPSKGYAPLAAACWGLTARAARGGPQGLRRLTLEGLATQNVHTVARGPFILRSMDHAMVRDRDGVDRPGRSAV